MSLHILCGVGAAFKASKALNVIESPFFREQDQILVRVTTDWHVPTAISIRSRLLNITEKKFESAPNMILDLLGMNLLPIETVNSLLSLKEEMGHPPGSHKFVTLCRKQIRDRVVIQATWRTLLSYDGSSRTDGISIVLSQAGDLLDTHHDYSSKEGTLYRWGLHCLKSYGNTYTISLRR